MADAVRLSSTGDAGARARLERWQQLTVKYQSDMMQLSATAGTGDLGAIKKAQALQIAMIREWLNASPGAVHSGNR